MKKIAYEEPRKPAPVKKAPQKTIPEIERDLGYDVLKVLKEGPAEDRAETLLKYDDGTFLKGLAIFLGNEDRPLNKMTGPLRKRWNYVKKKKDMPVELVAQISSALEKQKVYHTESAKPDLPKTEEPKPEEKPSKWKEVEEKAKEMMTKEELPENEKKRRLEILKKVKEEKAFDLAYRLFKKNLVAESRQLLNIVIALEEPKFPTMVQRPKRSYPPEHFPTKSLAETFDSEEEMNAWLDSITGKPSPKAPPKQEQQPQAKKPLRIEPQKETKPDKKEKSKKEPKSKGMTPEQIIHNLQQALNRATDPKAREEIQGFIDEEREAIAKRQKARRDQEES